MFGPMRRLCAVLVSVLLGVAATLLAAPASWAEPADEFGIFDTRGNLLAGFYRLRVDGQLISGMCIDFEHAPADTDIPWRLEPVAAPQFAYLAARHGNTNDPTQAAALAYLAHLSPELPHWDKRDPAVVLPNYRALAPAVALAKQWQADALAHAGPYRLTLDLGMATDGRSGQVRPQILSAAGVPMTGIDVHLSLAGPATFAGGGREHTVSAGGSVTVQANGNGPVTVRARATGLPGAQVWLALPHDASARSHDSAGYQRLITTRTDVQDLTAEAGFAHPFRLRFAPMVATQTSAGIAVTGQQLHDEQVISVRNGLWTGRVSVTSTLYGPLPSRPKPAAQAPPGTPVVARVSYSATGPGRYQTPPVRLPGPGYYVWQEHIAPGKFNDGWTGQYGLAAETTVVRWSPAVATAVRARHISIGTKIVDDFTLTGGRPDQQYTIAHTLYGPTSRPLPVGAPVPPGTPVADRVMSKVTAGQDGSVRGSSPSTTVTAAGYYTYTETITADEANNGWYGQTVREAETFLTRWSPQVKTQVSAPVVAVGEQVHDVLTISGVPPDADTTFDVQLLRTPGRWPTDGRAPDSTMEVVAKWTVSARGPGLVRSPSYRPSAPGSYAYWVTHSGSKTTDPFAPPQFPEPSESFVVPYSPTVATKVSQQRVAPGTQIVDVVSVSGGQPNTVISVALTLWGPILDRPPVQKRAGGNHGAFGVTDCAPTVSSAGQAGSAHPLARQTVSVSLDAQGAGRVQAKPFVVAGPGFYTVTDAIAGTDLSRCWASDFGIPAETVSVPWPVRIATQVSDHAPVLGGVVTDTVWIEGLPPNHGLSPAVWPAPQPGGLAPPKEAWDGVVLHRTSPAVPAGFGQHPTDKAELVLSLYGPFAQRPTSDTEPGQPVRQLRLPARNGEQVTELIGGLTQPGWYTFQAELVASDRVSGLRTPFGEGSETFVIAPPGGPPPGPPGSTAPVPVPAPPGPVEPVKPPVGAPPLAETGTGWWSWPLRDTGFILVFAGAAIILLTRWAERRQFTPRC